MPINYEDIFGATTPTTTRPTVSSNLDDYLGAKPDTQKQGVNLDQALQTLQSDLGKGSYKKSLNDLEQDKQFQQIASDFLRSIGESGDDIFEYMRDEDFNLTKGFTRWADATNFSEANKKRYAYLRSAFDNASIGSFGQGMELVKDAALDIVSDPANILGVLAGIFTGGVGTAASFAARQSTAQALKASLKSFAKSSVAPTPTNLRNTGQQFGRLLNLEDDAARLLGTSTMISTYEGLAHIGLGDVARQGTQIATDMKEAYNPLQTAAMLPIGTTLGQTFPLALTGTGKAIGAIAGPVVEAGSKVIGLEKYQNKLLNDYKQKINNYENEDFIRDDITDKAFQFQRSLSRLVGDDLGFLTFARATAPLRGLAKQAPTAKKLLLALKTDEAQRFLDMPELVKGLDFGVTIEKRRGLYRQKFMEIIQPIFDVDESIFARKFTLSPDNNEQLRQALLGKTTYGTNNTKISKVVLDAAKKLRALDNDMYADARAAGLNAPYLTEHFPRYYNRDALIEKKEIFITELKNSGQVDASLNDIVEELNNRPDLATNILVPFTEQETRAPIMRPFMELYDKVPDETSTLFYRHIKETYPSLIQEIEERKAFQVYNDLIDMANVDKSFARTISGGRGNFTGRSFEKLDDEFLINNGFIEGDVMNAFSNYFNRAIPIIVRTEKLGYNLDDFRTRFTEQIKNELLYKLDNKGNLLRDDKGRFIERENPLRLSEKDDKYLNQLYMYTTGKGLKGSGFIAEQVVPHLQFLNATAYLPLATVSSLTELALPFTRASLAQYAGEVGRPVQELKDTMVNKAKLLFNQQVDELRKLGLNEDDIYREMRIFGFANDQTARERAVSLSGEGLIETKFLGKGPEIYKLQDLFYKFNLLRDWTASVERTSYLIGKRIINDNIKKLALNKQLTSDFVPEIKSFKFQKGKDVGGWAKYNRDNNTIFIDEDELLTRFNDKAWTKPKVAGVTALPEDSFKTVDEFRTFIVNHEKNHAKFKKMQDESLADYENRINRLALEETQYKPLKASEELRLREQLVELGINPEDGINWYINGAAKYGKATYQTRSYDKLSDGRVYSTFYNELLNGAARFTNEVILNPSSASALKPMMYNHPQAKILFQFLSYPSAFTNTVLKKGIQRATRGMARGDLNNPAKLFSTFALMATSAMYLNNIRSSGKEFEKDPDEIFVNGISRTGITGVADTVLRVGKNIEYGGRGIPSVLAKSIGGPAVSDLIELFQFNRGIAETFSRKIPVINQILRTGVIPEGEDIPKLIQEAARELDKETFEILKAAFVEIGLVPEDVAAQPRIGKERGGLVFNVGQVTPEPEDRKVRGQPYTFKELAGFIVEDEEDRRGFVSGGTVAARGFANFFKRFLNSKLPGTKHTELHHIFDEQNKNLQKVMTIRDEDTKIRSYDDKEVDLISKMSEVKDDVYLSYRGNNIKDILTDKYFNQDNLGIKLTSSPTVGTNRVAKIHAKNILNLDNQDVPITMDNLTKSVNLKQEVMSKVKERSHEFGKFDQDLQGLLKDFDRVKQKLNDETDLDLNDRKVVMSYYNTKLFKLLEQAGFDVIKQQDNYFVPHVRNMVFRQNKYIEQAGDPSVIENRMWNKMIDLQTEYRRLFDNWMFNQDELTRLEYRDFQNKYIYVDDIGEAAEGVKVEKDQRFYKKFIKDVPQAERINNQINRLMEESTDIGLNIKRAIPQSSKVTDITMSPKGRRAREEMEVEDWARLSSAISSFIKNMEAVGGTSLSAKANVELMNKQLNKAAQKFTEAGYSKKEIDRLLWNLRKEMGNDATLYLDFNLVNDPQTNPATAELYNLTLKNKAPEELGQRDLFTPWERRQYKFDENFNLIKDEQGVPLTKTLDETLATPDKDVLSLKEQEQYTFDEDGYITGMYIRNKKNNERELIKRDPIKTIEDLKPKEASKEELQKIQDAEEDFKTFERKNNIRKWQGLYPENRTEEDIFLDDLFETDFVPDQKNLIKESTKLLNKKGKKDSNTIENIREEIFELSQLVYLKWFKGLPQAMQRDLDKIEELAGYDVNTSKFIGTGNMLGGTYKTRGDTPDVEKHVLDFYEENPDIVKLDKLSAQLFDLLFENS